MVWRDTQALRGGGFELLLDYNWIKKGGRRWCCVAPGLLGQGYGLFPNYRFIPKLSSACGCSCFLLSRNFQSWGQTQVRNSEE